jgi:hypothetical protein
VDNYQPSQTSTITNIHLTNIHYHKHPPSQNISSHRLACWSVRLLVDEVLTDEGADECGTS